MDVPLYLKEISPVKISAKIGAIHEIMFGGGITMAFLFICLRFQFWMGTTQFWKVQFGFPIIPAVAQGLLFLFVYKQDTPKYYYIMDKQNLVYIYIYILNSAEEP